MACPVALAGVVQARRRVKGKESNLVTLLRQSAEQLTAANAEVAAPTPPSAAPLPPTFANAAGELSHTVTTIGDNVTYHLRATTNEIAGLIEKSGVETAQRIEDSRGIVTQACRAWWRLHQQGHPVAQRPDPICRSGGPADFAELQLATARLAEQFRLPVRRCWRARPVGQPLFAQLNASGAEFAGRIGRRICRPHRPSQPPGQHRHQCHGGQHRGLYPPHRPVRNQILSGIEKSSLNLLNGLNTMAPS